MSYLIRNKCTIRYVLLKDIQIIWNVFLLHVNQSVYTTGPCFAAQLSEPLHTRLLLCATLSTKSQSRTKSYLIPCSITASIPPHWTHHSSLGSCHRQSNIKNIFRHCLCCVSMDVPVHSQLLCYNDNLIVTPNLKLNLGH